jgi:8-oxo-dGTP pyrophosphatase MutT (NUDIX family)
MGTHIEQIKSPQNFNTLPQGSTVKRFLSESFPYDQKFVTSVFCLVFCGEKVLFTQIHDEGHPEIDIPGGHVDNGETIIGAVEREVYEETGFVLDNPHFIAYDEITVPNSPPDYLYPAPKAYLQFYIANAENMDLENKNGLWLELDEARKIQWVQNNRALFESMYQEAKYLRGDFERSYLDVYDETGKTAIGTESYDTVHRQGLWHRGVHVFILTPEGKFVIQKRGPEVQLKPNLLEASAGGHINTGHTAIETVIYELHEEIGITVTENEIKYVGELIDQFTEQDGVIRNNEFDQIYLIRKAIHPDDIVIGKKEVSEVIFVDAKEYLQKGIAEDPSIAHRPEEYQMLYTYLYPESHE